MGNGNNRYRNPRNNHMTIFSKILTLNKLHILEKITGIHHIDSTPSDYFNIGMPIENPPLLRGSIIIELNITFLTENSDFFEGGSPIDTGSVKFGFLKPSYDKDEFLKLSHCNYEKFHALTDELFKLPNSSLIKLLNHAPCPSFKPVLEKHFNSPILDFMYNEKNPHAWLFEFSLSNQYKLSEKHINKIYIPNTYLFNNTIKSLQKTLKRKVITYNPKYGIENRAR
ncbi:conserved hypothetical protein [Pseudomonas sp. IT-P100]|uniref:hypothetical protein n=1 Tax=Pseudomonas sp. IT-P100 TaxID=3026452 RepID=UPI0039E104D7